MKLNKKPLSEARLAPLALGMIVLLTQASQAQLVTGVNSGTVTMGTGDSIPADAVLDSTAVVTFNAAGTPTYSVGNILGQNPGDGRLVFDTGGGETTVNVQIGFGSGNYSAIGQVDVADDNTLTATSIFNVSGVVNLGQNASLRMSNNTNSNAGPFEADIIGTDHSSVFASTNSSGSNLRLSGNLKDITIQANNSGNFNYRMFIEGGTATGDSIYDIEVGLRNELFITNGATVNATGTSNANDLDQGEVFNRGELTINGNSRLLTRQLYNQNIGTAGILTVEAGSSFDVEQELINDGGTITINGSGEVGGGLFNKPSGEININGMLVVSDNITQSQTTVIGNILNTGNDPLINQGTIRIGTAGELVVNNGSIENQGAAGIGIDGKLRVTNTSVSSNFGSIVLNSGADVDLAGGISNNSYFQINGGTYTGLRDFRQNNLSSLLDMDGGLLETRDFLANAGRATLANGARIEATREVFFASSSSTVLGKNTEIDAGNGGGLMSFNSGADLEFELIDNATGLLRAGFLDFSNADITVTDGGGNTVSAGDSWKVAEAGTSLTMLEQQLAANFAGTNLLIRLVNGTYGSLGGTINEAYLIALAAYAASNGNNQAAELILSGLGGSSDPELQDVINNLNSASSQEEYDAILASVLPTIDNGDMVATLELLDQTLDITSRRLDSVRKGYAFYTMDSMPEGVRVWGQAFGSQLDQDERDEIAGYEIDSYGVAAGIDSDRLLADGVLGLAFSYTDSTVRSGGANRARTEIESFQLSAYGSYDFDNMVFVKGALAYVYGENERTRHGVGGLPGLDAKSDFDSHTFNAAVEVGRDFRFAEFQEGLTVTPHVNAAFTHYSADDYRETGAGGAGLEVEQDSLRRFELGLGVDASMIFETSSGLLFIPQASLGASYDLLDEEVEATSQFLGGGASFDTDGLEPSRLAGNAGLGLSVFNEAWEFTLAYGYEFKSDFNSHSASFRAAYSF